MDVIVSAWNKFLQLVRQFQLSDAIDIAVVSFIIYSAIKLIRETRAGQLVKGIVVLLIMWGLSYVMKLYMLETILAYFFQYALIVLVVIFQPELRRALEQIGRSDIRKKNWLSSSSDEKMRRYRRAINAVVDAAAQMSKQKTGALMVFEMKTKLGDIVDTGTVINAIPSLPIICNIFFNKAPLHDGAMIVVGRKIKAAGCILPISQNPNIPTHLGLRHRAGLGISQETDAKVIIVSEERGKISFASQGRLKMNISPEDLQRLLLEE